MWDRRSVVAFYYLSHTTALGRGGRRLKGGGENWKGKEKIERKGEEVKFYSYGSIENNRKIA